MPDLTVSVVVPTRNRPESLRRLLRSLESQLRSPDEVIIVDASEPPLDPGKLRLEHPKLALKYLHTPPSVCSQRNAGIRLARSSHVLLCDDDMELPSNYTSELVRFVQSNPDAGCVTGFVSEPDEAGRFAARFSTPTARHLLFAFLFQLTVWGDAEGTEGSGFTRIGVAAVKRWYRRRGNTWSLAGWPLITQVRDSVVRTSIYGLGAALVRRDWLLLSPYEEDLGPHGIGDNYGVALGFPQERPIRVLPHLKVLHHRDPRNRLGAEEAFYLRVLALDRFMRRDARFSLINRAFLAWSLAGSAGIFLARGKTGLLMAALRALAVVLAGRNPLPSAPRTRFREAACGSP
jgi:glycosyltransferase involved in cell wall biosynthesis